jgi:hypothetical protein
LEIFLPLKSENEMFLHCTSQELYHAAHGIMTSVRGTVVAFPSHSTQVKGKATTYDVKLLCAEGYNSRWAHPTHCKDIYISLLGDQKISQKQNKLFILLIMFL